MMKVAVVFSFLFASPIVRAHRVHADSAVSEGRGRVILKGSAKPGGGGRVILKGSAKPKDDKDNRDCRKLQREAEKSDPENGPMPKCKKGSDYCDLPEFFCDQRDPDPERRRAEARRTCTVSPTNKQASAGACGEHRCRDDDGCFCGDMSDACMEKTCVDLQREECPNSLVHGRCSASSNKCNVGGFKCDLRVGSTEEMWCSSSKTPNGPGPDHPGPGKPIIKPISDARPSVGTPLPMTAIVGAAVMIAVAMN